MCDFSSDLVAAYYEGLQDKLTQLRDAREALDSLREEHREKRRREMEEMERQRQIQMMQKLEVMRQKKHVSVPDAGRDCWGWSAQFLLRAQSTVEQKTGWIQTKPSKYVMMRIHWWPEILHAIR